jgi:thioesterase domain-containing protein
MAQRLVAAGEEVALVVLVDTICPTLGYSWRNRLRALGVGGVVKGVRRRLSRQAEAVPDANIPKARRRAARYAPLPSVAPVLLVRAAESAAEVGDPLLGWGPLLREDAEVVEVPGGHLTMLQLPVVRQIGERIGAALRR